MLKKIDFQSHSVETSILLKINGAQLQTEAAGAKLELFFTALDDSPLTLIIKTILFLFTNNRASGLLCCSEATVKVQKKYRISVAIACDRRCPQRENAKLCDKVKPQDGEETEKDKDSRILFLRV